MHRLAQRCFVAMMAATLWLGCAPSMVEAKQNQSSPRLALKDPTPRPADLEKLNLSAAGSAKPANKRPEQSYNERRLALIAQASNQVQSLAGVLAQAMKGDEAKVTPAAEAQVADAIETLAANIHRSLSPGASQSSASSREHGAESEPMERRAAAEQLLALANSLEAEVGRTHSDDLPLALIGRSAEVEDLAHRIKVSLTP